MSSLVVQRKSLPFPDQGITWAGECPWTGSLCFGTEDGELLVGKQVGDDDLKILPPNKVAKDAINDVAFWKDFIGISTPSEVVFARRSSSDDRIHPAVIRTPDGAHGILATPQGHFFAPMGTSGLLRVDAGKIPVDEVTIDKPDQATPYFYRLIYLGKAADQEILACAARTSGLLMIKSGSDHMDVEELVSQDVDFVDVCSMDSQQWPHAVVGLSLDGTLIFVRDLTQPQPQALRLEELHGTPYSILRADGHLFVLTSKRIVALPNLLTRYLQGDRLDRPFRCPYTPIQAVDAYVAYGKHLLIVMDKEVRSFEIASLLQPAVEPGIGNGPPGLRDWGGSEQKLSSVQLSFDSHNLAC